MILQGGNRQGALADGGEDDVGRDHGVGHVEPQSLQARAGEHDGVRGTLAHLAHARIYVAPDRDDLKVRPAMQELRPPPQAGGGDHCPARQAFYRITLVGDQRVRRVVTLGARRERYAGGQLRRYVLERVDGEVYLPLE